MITDSARFGSRGALAIGAAGLVGRPVTGHRAGAAREAIAALTLAVGGTGGRIDRATARAHRDVHPFPETGASLARRVAPDGVVAPLLAESEICLWWWSGYV